ncbi:alpha/beta fold hydrolase [Nocardioides sp. dk4132]|uniref:alpha/beta hydrolase family protein n=1 Tax=unclassified Nocardioides TaxID=2615069 RepID=UPI0012980A32|nr:MULTISPECIES: alpha/beta fold hydrolase [unclassified Nocardioides]MQW74623.1 alpha/beta fold hydrolase [Nocardioides sp. dk4132]QGA06536.1 alpha/beta fold hydrolase [Nocardioides sp. dk884]
MVRRAAIAAAALLLVVPLAGCSDEPPSDTGARPTPSGSASARSPEAGPSDGGAGASAGAPSGVAPGEESLPRVRDAMSLPALMREDVEAGRIRRTGSLGGTGAWNSWSVTYTVDGAAVSGELLVPTGRGPFPAVVLNHGYIDPAIYTLGRGMSREQEWLAANGFVVLHTDYRGHAGSDPVSDLGRESRLVYTRDAIGAVGALRREAYVDDDRLAMIGRSMGGAVTYNALVADPDLVDAAVVFAPVSSAFTDNLRRWTIPERPDNAQVLFERLGGPPERNPRPYRELSARTYFDRIEAPVLIHHGTLDDSCPIAWSRETQRLLREAGVDSRLLVYEGEGHAFGPRFEDSMRATVDFLRRELGGAR